MINSIVKFIQGIVQVRGATDGTLVGNTSDRLNVSSEQSGTWDINNINGTVSLPTGASTSANQTNGSQKTQVVDASNNTVTSKLIDSVNNYRALDTITSDRVIASSALGALNAAVSISMEGQGSAGFQLSTGTLSATLIAEQSIDGGTTWIQAQFFDPVTLVVSNTIILTNPNPLKVVGIVSMQGASNVRARISSYTSGSATGYLRSVSSTGYQVTTPQDLSDLSANQIFCFAIDTLNVASSGTNNPLILLRNPSSSTINAYLKTIRGGITVTNNSCVYNVYGNPTVTANGSPQVVYSRSIGSSATAQLLVNTLPTISANGNLLSSFNNAQNSNSVEIIDANQLRIAPNSSVLITGNPSSNNRNTVLTVIWSEK